MAGVAIRVPKGTLGFASNIDSATRVKGNIRSNNWVGEVEDGTAIVRSTTNKPTPLAAPHPSFRLRIRILHEPTRAVRGQRPVFVLTCARV